jgi:hypothetical protein
MNSILLAWGYMKNTTIEVGVETYMNNISLAWGRCLGLVVSYNKVTNERKCKKL